MVGENNIAHHEINLNIDELEKEFKESQLIYNVKMVVIAKNKTT